MSRPYHDSDVAVHIDVHPSDSAQHNTSVYSRHRRLRDVDGSDSVTGRRQGFICR